MRDVVATPYGSWDVVREGSELAILAVGTMVEPSLAAADALAIDGFDVTVVNCRFLKPHDSTVLAAVLARHRHVLVVEEGTVVNGFGAYMSSVIAQLDPGVRVSAHGVPDRIVYAASRKRQLAMTGLDAEGIASKVRAMHASEALAG